MSEKSNISKVAETFETLYKERKRMLQNILQKFKEAREKMNKEYSNRRHGTANLATLKAVKLKKKVTIDARGPDAISMEEEPIVSDYQVEESDNYRYKVEVLLKQKEVKSNSDISISFGSPSKPPWKKR